MERLFSIKVPKKQVLLAAYVTWYRPCPHVIHYFMKKNPPSFLAILIIYYLMLQSLSSVQPVMVICFPETDHAHEIGGNKIGMGTFFSPVDSDSLLITTLYLFVTVTQITEMFSAMNEAKPGNTVTEMSAILTTFRQRVVEEASPNSGVI